MQPSKYIGAAHQSSVSVLRSEIGSVQHQEAVFIWQLRL